MRLRLALAPVAAALAIACGFFPEVGPLRDDQAAPPGGTSGGGDTSSGGTSGGGTTSGGDTSSGGTSGGGTSGGTSGGGTSSGGTSDGGPDAGPRTWNVMVGPNDKERFDPANLTIKAGDSVKWLWLYGGHNVVADDGSFCSPNDANCGGAPEQPKGSVYTRTFTSPGVYKYHCDPHSDDNMRGTITVE